MSGTKKYATLCKCVVNRSWHVHLNQIEEGHVKSSKNRAKAGAGRGNGKGIEVLAGIMGTGT